MCNSTLECQTLGKGDGYKCSNDNGNIIFETDIKNGQITSSSVVKLKFKKRSQVMHTDKEKTEKNHI